MLSELLSETSTLLIPFYHAALTTFLETTTDAERAVEMLGLLQQVLTLADHLLRLDAAVEPGHPLPWNLCQADSVTQPCQPEQREFLSISPCLPRSAPGLPTPPWVAWSPASPL